MKTLKRLLAWWEQQSDSDFYAAMEIDTHRWANRSGLLQRLSGQADQPPQEHESDHLALSLMPLLPQ